MNCCQIYWETETVSKCAVKSVKLFGNCLPTCSRQILSPDKISPMLKEFQFWFEERACSTSSSSSAASQPSPTVAPSCTAPSVRWWRWCHHWWRWWKENTAHWRWCWREQHTSTPLLCRALQVGRQRRTAARIATTAASAKHAKCATPCAPTSASTALSAPQTVSNLDIVASNAMWLAFLTTDHAWAVDATSGLLRLRGESNFLKNQKMSKLHVVYFN